MFIFSGFGSGRSRWIGCSFFRLRRVGFVLVVSRRRIMVFWGGLGGRVVVMWSVVFLWVWG